MSANATLPFVVRRLVHGNATQAGYRWKFLSPWGSFAEAEHAAIIAASKTRGLRHVRRGGGLHPAGPREVEGPLAARHRPRDAGR